MSTLLESNIPELPLRRGKVRDIYDLGDRLLLVATDRISAFDWVLPTPIPDKGRILTQLSLFWFRQLGVENHFLSSDLQGIELPASVDHRPLEGRSLIVRKAAVIPVECVVRGYLEGSGWKAYRETGEVCGVKLPPGLAQGSQLPEPIFTPATKEESGHDINITFEQMVGLIGRVNSEELRDRSLDLYQRAAAYALERGIIIADTKFEWGEFDSRIILIDEALTPDSSRFWPLAGYTPGKSQPSFDKQFVRNWLEQSGWDKNSPPPELPAEIVAGTRSKYLEAYERLTGERLT
jgi:phosphoribosylaminoimidazole-succinocarboxamide synthase